MWKYFIITGGGILFLLLLWVVIKPEFPSIGSGKFVRLSYRDLENWSSDRQGQAFSAFKKSCRVFLAAPAGQKILPAGLGGRAGDWQSPCKAAEKTGDLTDIQARSFFERNFTLLSYSDKTEGLFTGYFAPEYAGSDRRSEQYSYPLYAVPKDLKILDLGKFDPSLQGKTITGEIKAGEFVPYKDRENIDSGALKNKQLELVWLRNPMDAFFMHIQGSGVILYANGTRRIFGYAGKNGRAYHSIGKFLIENGEISSQDMSMQAIRKWLQDNPAKARSLMWKNPSYIFFRPLKETAPVGSMNIALTSGRSLAIDPQYVPLGMPLWLDLNPATDHGKPVRRLVIAQDTGAAIRGRMRADIYWGVGDDAARLAGPMKEAGRYYFLVPKGLADRILSRKSDL